MSEKKLTNKLTQNEAVVCVVGLGYVGLPLAKNFSFTKKPLLKKELKKKPLLKKETVKKQKEGENAAQVLEVIGFDIDEEKIEKLKKGIINDEFGVGDISKSKIAFTSNPAAIRKADFVIIAVPTPVTKSKEPDLSYVKLFCFAKTFTKNAYAIRSGDYW